MPNPQYTIHLVSGLFIRDEQVLLGLRINTKDYPKHWSVPIGHVEKCETNEQAIVREMLEELGIHIDKLLTFCCKTDQSNSIHHQVFEIKQWRGEIENCEPALCEQLKWFTFESLPENITPISLDIIKMYQQIYNRS